MEQLGKDTSLPKELNERTCDLDKVSCFGPGRVDRREDEKEMLEEKEEGFSNSSLSWVNMRDTHTGACTSILGLSWTL